VNCINEITTKNVKNMHVCTANNITVNSLTVVSTSGTLTTEPTPPPAQTSTDSIPLTLIITIVGCAIIGVLIVVALVRCTKSGTPSTYDVEDPNRNVVHGGGGVCRYHSANAYANHTSHIGYCNDCGGADSFPVGDWDIGAHQE
jgi:hypothetical protein